VQAPEYTVKQEKGWQRGAIHGQLAGSFAEYVVALALWYLKVRFIYKYQLRDTRFVIDFYIDAGPDWVPVDVRQFWGFEEDSKQRFRREMIERILKRPLEIVWNYQVSTFEEAITTMRRVVRWV
jgi:hypothetical protein